MFPRNQETGAEQMRTKRAEKRGITPRKLAIARAAALTNKCHESLAAIYNLTPRQVRRKIEQVKGWAGVECITELAHWFHAHRIGFTSDAERDNYLEQESKLRELNKAA
jgi:hypothetical protein